MTSLPTAFASLLLSLFASVTTPVEPAAPTVAAAPVAPFVAPAGLADRRVAAAAAFEQHVLESYARSGLLPAGLPVLVYREAVVGFYNLQQRGKISPDQHLLTIVDFSRSSRSKRLCVIDLRAERLLFQTLVAHGRNSGEEFARTFSNREGSEMSSLGFYRTGRTYSGRHGLSLKLHGLDADYNTNAFDRSVVMHAADYVSEDFVRQHGRLGRSQGCPALPAAESAAIIRTIKNGTVLYLHGPQTAPYASNWLNLEMAVQAFAQGADLAAN